MLHGEAVFHSTACNVKKGDKRENPKPNLLKVFKTKFSILIRSGLSGCIVKFLVESNQNDTFL